MREPLEDEVRHLMWVHHGHVGIYGDDGEMQCSECSKYGCWDYRNAPLDEVRKAYQMARFEILDIGMAKEGDTIAPNFNPFTMDSGPLKDPGASDAKAQSPQPK